MSTKTSYFVTAFAALMVLAGCIVQKRHYLKGFHVDWKRSVKAPAATAKQTGRELEEPPAEAVAFTAVPPPPESISASASSSLAVLPEKNSRNTNENLKQDCDVLLMRTGEDLRVKVIEITPELIKYRRCDNPDGPLYSIKKRDVFSITYANGVKEVIEAPPEQPVQASSPPPSGRRPLMGTAAGAFVVSMLGAFYSMSPDSTGLAVLLLVMGLVLSIRALVRLGKTTEYRGKGFTVAAFVISVVFGLLLLLVVTA